MYSAGRRWSGSEWITFDAPNVLSDHFWRKGLAWGISFVAGRGLDSAYGKGNALMCKKTSEDLRAYY